MDKDFEIKHILQVLEFNEAWFDLELVSTEKLQELYLDFQTAEDTNKEHYRWRAFTDFLKSEKKFGENVLREFYRLGEIDTDSMMGTAMQINILQRKDCPSDLIEKALNSDDKALIKVVKRKLGLDYK